nr:2916_t:CDS:2 [Entrophospora candida]
MPKGKIEIEEVIEKMEQFSEMNSEDNKNILQQILNKIDEQSGEITKLNKKITDLETALKEGKFGGSVGSIPSTSTNPSSQNPSQQTSGGGDSTTSSGSTEAQKKEKAGLTIEDAKKIYSNGWNKPNLTEYESDGQKATSIEPLNHKRSEIEKALKLLNKIKNETNLSNLPGNNDIETYDQSKVPNNINHDGIKRERDNKLKSLFKDAFEKGGASGLSEDDIDK